MKVKIINNSPNELPKYESKGASGVDLRAWVGSKGHSFVYGTSRAKDKEGNDVIHIMPGGRCKIDTGLQVAIPEGYELQIRPRSGLTLKQGIIAQLGTVDNDFRGRIGLILVNLSMEVITIHEGDRMAQGVFNKFERADFEPIEDFDEEDKTERGERGFGGSGIK